MRRLYTYPVSDYLIYFSSPKIDLNKPSNSIFCRLDMTNEQPDSQTAAKSDNNTYKFNYKLNTHVWAIELMYVAYIPTNPHAYIFKCIIDDDTQTGPEYCI